MWLPLVRRSTSAASSSSADSGVTPAPPALFSALTTTRSSPCRAMSFGTKCFTACRPGLAKTSPRNRIFKARALTLDGERLSRGRPEKPALGDQEVERRVVRLLRHLGHDLRLEGQPDSEGRAREGGEGGVVVAAAAAEPDAARVEGHAGNEDAVD